MNIILEVRIYYYIDNVYDKKNFWIRVLLIYCKLIEDIGCIL